MLTFLEGARTRVQAASRGYRGRLRIGLIERLAQPQLAKLLAKCREEEPLTEVRIFEMTAKEMINALKNDQIDAALSVQTGLSNDFIKKIVWTDRPVIAIPKNHPLLSFEKIPPHEIIRHSLILYHPELCPGVYNAIYRGFCEFTLPLPAVTEYVSGHESMLILVAAGYGIGLGLESQVTLYHHPNVIIRHFTDEIPSVEIIISMLDKPPSEELERFIERAIQAGETKAID
ncbi:LysR family substrate-binding domain-containing protein [Pseudomonas sp. NBRC 100443]|uniref:LysR family substrate-binding domain-containing protein n=1 Tax=Pseudomonas sp. NBRC 100443 TaxID=1113665 RepID=UPI002554C50F|nr:LysR family substrate-binding domain-containing protein [Pseudomonas sp. NBRC 100443]